MTGERSDYSCECPSQLFLLFQSFRDPAMKRSSDVHIGVSAYNDFLQHVVTAVVQTPDADSENNAERGRQLQVDGLGRFGRDSG